MDEPMQEWVVCLEESLPSFGIAMGHMGIKALAKVMQDNAALIADMSFEARGGRPTDPAVDYKSLYEVTKNRLEVSEKENAIFRQSVANRRGVDVSSVRIENGTVMVYQ